MRTLFVSLVLGATIVPAVASTTSVPFPTGAQSTSDPRMIAFYESQCSQMAQQAGVGQQETDQRRQNCLKDAPSIWPAGTAEPGPGE